MGSPKADGSRASPLPSPWFGLVVFSWAALALWAQSHYAYLLVHDVAPTSVARAGVAVIAWTLMIVGVMVPSTTLLVTTFARLVRRRHNAKRLLAILLSAYVAVWLAIGVLFHAADLVLHYFVTPSAPASGMIVSGALMLAGAYQLLPIKQRCLTRCRTPLGIIVSHWSGLRPRADALAIGAHHAWFCVGCCWALMVVMFGIGTTHLLVMMALGLIMVVEKTWHRGTAVTGPAGFVLLALGAVLGLSTIPTL